MVFLRLIGQIQNLSQDFIHKNKKFCKNSSSEVDFFPYISVSQEEVTGEQENKIGGEIFWAIDSEKRLDVTLNPDFGQVESDDVIVSFDALETFYEDKRPFFTENQDLFQIRGRTSFLINTRRIGANQTTIALQR